MIVDWCRERKIAKPLLHMSELELNEALRRFYAEARNKNGGEYSRSSLLGFRSAVERHFAANNVQLKLTNNPIFQTSNNLSSANSRSTDVKPKRMSNTIQ